MVIVDTNVAVVANHGHERATSACVAACAHNLQRITSGSETLAIDNKWHIVQEYRRQLKSSGQPGAGDAFLKWVLTYRANPSRCIQVAITPTKDERVFREFPADPELAGFDRSDRVFVAVALAHPDRPPILNAVDSDWAEYRKPLSTHGVQVDFVCGIEAATRARPRKP